MTKAELIAVVAERQEIKKSAAGRIIEDIFSTIAATIESGDVVSIGGFGIFKPVTRAARMAPNPATGGKVNVPAKKTVVFKPAKAIKDALN